MSKYRAINDSVIVEIPQVNAKQTVQESGLILVQQDGNSNKNTVTGIVVSVGEGKFDTNRGIFIAPPLKLGDKVLLSLATGIALDETHKMIRTDDIFAVVE